MASLKQPVYSGNFTHLEEHLIPPLQCLLEHGDEDFVALISSLLNVGLERISTKPENVKRHLEALDTWVKPIDERREVESKKELEAYEKKREEEQQEENNYWSRFHTKEDVDEWGEALWTVVKNCEKDKYLVLGRDHFDQLRELAGSLDDQKLSDLVEEIWNRDWEESEE